MAIRGGYRQRILFVDLGTARLETRVLDESLARRYVGGSGIGARLLVDLGGPRQTDADDPASPVIAMTGPLCGTTLPSVCRSTVSAVSPLTGVWGESNVGGYFGPEVKFAGYDGIVVTGSSGRPVYLLVTPGRTSIEPADDLWGTDAYDACDRLTERHRDASGRSGQTFAIGTAGERGALFASIVNKKHHVAGRTGMGTVFGRKRLKAITVCGSDPVTVADRGLFDEVRRRLLERMKESIVIESLREAGTNAGMDPCILLGDVPIQNWRRGEWDEGYDNLNATTYSSAMLVGRKTCFSCPVACKREVEVKEGRFPVRRGAGPEYETVVTMGLLCMNEDLSSVARANELCNRHGLDTITMGSTIAFAMECFEHGLLTRSDTGGLDLSWGASEAVVECVELTGRQEGFGRMLGLGSARMAAAIGRGSERFLTTVRRLEAPMHDPRAAHGMGLAYATAPRGACHVSSLNLGLEHGSASLPEIGLAGPFEEKSSEGKALLTKLAQDLGTVMLGSAAVCQLAGNSWSASDLRDALVATTGIDWTLDELMTCGERIWTLKRCIACVMGSTAVDDRLPERLLTALDSGGAAGSVPDLEAMLAEFHRLREIDERGRPSAAALQRLGLEDMISRLD